MTEDTDTKNYHDLIFQGAKEAINLEIRQLREEGCPVLIWKKGKIVDFAQAISLRENGRIWFIIGIALFLTAPIFIAMISVGNHDMPMNFSKNMALLFGVICLGAFGLGFWYGDRKTCRNSMIFIAAIFPILIYLIYSYFANGFF